MLKGKELAGLDYLPSSGIIILVWMTVSRYAAPIKQQSWATLLTLASACLLVHVLLLLASWGVTRLLRLPAGRAKALVFVASQKTLPLALAVLLLLPVGLVPPAMRGAATIVCVIFHFSQIILDSLIAARVRET